MQTFAAMSQFMDRYSKNYFKSYKLKFKNKNSRTIGHGADDINRVSSGH